MVGCFLCFDAGKYDGRLFSSSFFAARKKRMEYAALNNVDN